MQQKFAIVPAPSGFPSDSWLERTISQGAAEYIAHERLASYPVGCRVSHEQLVHMAEASYMFRKRGRKVVPWAKRGQAYKDRAISEMVVIAQAMGLEVETSSDCETDCD
ncbi:hypothetical protein [Thalassospira xiamenensis]|uniref:Uncharacterized protein n=1 Tax=Thalassospira xiamenensis TaxID=220697 RepID=A0A285TTK8_9PROT|nr:hypothetical protein [Thalassospira xiamenensis]SOC27420.1 hypothetical protein SAMN05428964_105407 [Thalassospira xiamenensis]